MSRSARKPKTVEKVVPLCTVTVVEKRGVVERKRASYKARAVLGERGRVGGGERGARGDNQHIGAVVR